jgi:hypothetical protein
MRRREIKAKRTTMVCARPQNHPKCPPDLPERAHIGAGELISETNVSNLIDQIR